MSEKNPTEPEIMDNIGFMEDTSTKVVKELFSRGDLILKTDIPDVFSFIALEAEGLEFGCDLYLNICDLFIEAQVSHKRKSREEFIKAHTFGDFMRNYLGKGKKKTPLVPDQDQGGS